MQNLIIPHSKNQSWKQKSIILALGKKCGYILCISHNYDGDLQPKEGNAFETLLEVFNSTILGKDISGNHKSYYIFGS